ncbi:hypothetical protein K2173_009490 [Erythroxylum novogranatense]|uniref:RING-type E3 ubiquitin transferase n=1 Tax=Erythroxylum novogranatense TaxID=1862640 RepID=A0AAV8U7I4_9ROSI|nr:hypothetical protein K2173_009490 [Erythroxylum novogranatense]
MSTNSSLVPQASNFSSTSLTVILTTVLLVCFFIGFFSIYFCRYFMHNIISTLHFRRTPSGNIVNPANVSVNQGLDPALVQIFPTFTYSGIKGFQCDKFGIECAICLVEFTDDNLLRLITVCYHVFHKECIDLWFESLKTCPVCRGDLDLPKETLEKTLALDHSSDIHNVGTLENAVSITIQQDGDGNLERVPHDDDTPLLKQEEEDRHTLRLQEHVKEKIIRGHSAVRSCIAFGDFSTHKNGVVIHLALKSLDHHQDGLGHPKVAEQMGKLV